VADSNGGVDFRTLGGTELGMETERVMKSKRGWMLFVSALLAFTLVNIYRIYDYSVQRPRILEYNRNVDEVMARIPTTVDVVGKLKTTQRLRQVSTGWEPCGNITNLYSLDCEYRGADIERRFDGLAYEILSGDVRANNYTIRFYGVKR
jgi:hypothetical protein